MPQNVSKIASAAVTPMICYMSECVVCGPERYVMVCTGGSTREAEGALPTRSFLVTPSEPLPKITVSPLICGSRHKASLLVDNKVIVFVLARAAVLPFTVLTKVLVSSIGC